MSQQQAFPEELWSFCHALREVRRGRVLVIVCVSVYLLLFVSVCGLVMTGALRRSHTSQRRCWSNAKRCLFIERTLTLTSRQLRDRTAGIHPNALIRGLSCSGASSVVKGDFMLPVNLGTVKLSLSAHLFAQFFCFSFPFISLAGKVLSLFSRFISPTVFSSPPLNYMHKHACKRNAPNNATTLFRWLPWKPQKHKHSCSHVSGVESLEF